MICKMDQHFSQYTARMRGKRNLSLTTKEPVTASPSFLEHMHVYSRAWMTFHRLLVRRQQLELHSCCLWKKCCWIIHSPKWPHQLHYQASFVGALPCLCCAFISCITQLHNKGFLLVLCLQVALLGCGVSTGWGAVDNTAKVR